LSIARRGRRRSSWTAASSPTFRVWLFDAPGVLTRPTFGLRVAAPRAAPSPPAWGRFRPLALTFRVLRTAAEASDARFTTQAVRARTWTIEPSHFIADDPSPALREALHDLGPQAAHSFLERFDISAYSNVYGRTLAPTEMLRSS
jgi:hypothetical protein